MPPLFIKLNAATYRFFRYPVITPTLISLIIVLVVYSSPAQIALVLIEGELWSQIWRMFGVHLVHLNVMHGLFNIIGLWLLTYAFRDLFSNRLMFNVMLFSALFATLLPVYIAHDYYFVGFSGVLHGLLAYAGLRTLALDKTKGLVLLAVLGLKLIYDVVTAGQSVDWLNGAHVAYWCHLGGTLGGVIAVPALRKTSREFLRRP